MKLNFLDIYGSSLSGGFESQINSFKYISLFIVAAFIVILIFVVTIFIKHSKNVHKIKDLKGILNEIKPEVEQKEESSLCEYCGSVMDKNTNECSACGARKVKK